MRRAKYIEGPTKRIAEANTEMENRRGGISQSIEGTQMLFKANLVEMQNKIERAVVDILQIRQTVDAFFALATALDNWWRGERQQDKANETISAGPWYDFVRDAADGKFDGKAPYLGSDKSHNLMMMLTANAFLEFRVYDARRLSMTAAVARHAMIANGKPTKKAEHIM